MAVCGAAAMLFVAPGMSGAQPGQRAILAANLRTELHRIADDTKGVVGAQVIDLATGERIGVNDTKALRRIADAAYGYFHVLATSTPYGARVPLDVIPK